MKGVLTKSLMVLSLSVFLPLLTHAGQMQPAHTQSVQQEIGDLFTAIHTQGVVVVQDGETIQVYGNDLARAQTAYVPTSTFKMVNALIGLENNKVTVDEVFKWDGQKKSYPMWEKDMNLGQAMKVSAVPVYQALARRIGLDLMQKEVKRIRFGNMDIGKKVDKFWLVGPLKVTPIQEVNFAHQLAYKTLPFQQHVQQQVQDMLLIEEINGYKVYAKSGWGMGVKPQVGWLTGWVKQPNGHKVAFALNMKMETGMQPTVRNEILFKALMKLNIIK